MALTSDDSENGVTHKSGVKTFFAGVVVTALVGGAAIITSNVNDANQDDAREKLDSTLTAKIDGAINRFNDYTLKQKRIKEIGDTSEVPWATRVTTDSLGNEINKVDWDLANLTQRVGGQEQDLTDLGEYTKNTTAGLQSSINSTNSAVSALEQKVDSTSNEAKARFEFRAAKGQALQKSIYNAIASRMDEYIDVAKTTTTQKGAGIFSTWGKDISMFTKKDQPEKRFYGMVLGDLALREGVDDLTMDILRTSGNLGDYSQVVDSLAARPTVEHLKSSIWRTGKSEGLQKKYGKRGDITHWEGAPDSLRTELEKYL